MSIWIFDIDGTLANCDHRLHHVKKPSGEKKNWPAFFKAIPEDTVIHSVREIYNTLVNAGSEVYLCTGRPETYRESTEKWLEDNFISGFKALIMRPVNDSRPDFAAKKDALLKELGHGKIGSVSGIFEDRLQVCEAWREMGIPVFVVGDEWRKTNG